MYIQTVAQETPQFYQVSNSGFPLKPFTSLLSIFTSSKSLCSRKRVHRSSSALRAHPNHLLGNFYLLSFAKLRLVHAKWILHIAGGIPPTFRACHHLAKPTDGNSAYSHGASFGFLMRLTLVKRSTFGYPA
jgi:hypothetical protein